MQLEKFIREYSIRSYECDCRETLRIVALMNIFQDIADSHASVLGVGIEHCLQHGLAWVGTNYHIKINRMPSWHEQIKVASWPSAEKKIGAVRDFEVVDDDGEVIIVASRVLIDFNRKRPVSLRENLPSYQVIEQRALDTEFAKIETPQRIDISRSFAVRYDDIDVNRHVNNSIYPLWASESVGADFRLHHQPQEIEIAFKKECLYGDVVTVNTQIDDEISLHDIVAGEDGREVAKIRIKWQKI